MKVTWYGTASLIIEHEGTVIAVDPFLNFPYDRKVDHSELAEKAFQRAQSVLVTHGHFDHIYNIPHIYRDMPVKVYCTGTPAKSLINNGLAEEKICRIHAGDVFSIGSLHIKAFQSKHVSIDFGAVLLALKRLSSVKKFVHACRIGLVQKELPEAGEILAFEIDDGNAKLMIMGSIGYRRELEYPKNINTLILAFQGKKWLDEDALKIVRGIEPSEVFLYHYDDSFPPISHRVNTEVFINIMKEKHPDVTVKEIEFNKEITIGPA